MTLQEYLRVLRERWIVVLACLLLGLVGAGVVTSVTPRQYSAAVTMYVSAQVPADNASAAYQGGLLSQQRIKSYAELLASGRIANEVIATLQLPMSPEELIGRISVSSAVETVLLRAEVTDTEPARAADIANAVAGAFIRLVAELEQPPDAGPPPITARIVQAAVPSPDAVSPQLRLNLMLGGLLGLMIGLGAAFLRSVLDITVKSPEQLRQATGAPNIGAIAFDPQVPKNPLTVHDDPQAPRAEAFRQLRTNLQFVDVDHQRKVIVMTSALPGEGKSTTLCNLAIAAAAAGTRVLVIEADLRRPKVADYVGLDRSVGLTSVLAGRLPVGQAVQPWGGGAFDVLASGPIPPNPSELLSSRQMADLLDDARREYDLVLVDTPPLLPVTDAAAVAPASDGVILVVRYGRTTRPQVTAAAEALAAVSAPLLGTVMSMVPSSGPRAYAQYHSYYTSDASRRPRADSGVQRNGRSGSPSPHPRPLSSRPAVSDGGTRNVEPPLQRNRQGEPGGKPRRR